MGTLPATSSQSRSKHTYQNDDNVRHIVALKEVVEALQVQAVGWQDEQKLPTHELCTNMAR
jgi:hypothetical protein